MVHGLVSLSVPTVELVAPDHLAAALESALPGPLVGIAEGLGGVFQGTALLVFPAAGSLPLVRASLPPGIPAEDAAEMEEEGLAEIGNIVLNSALARIANLLGSTIQTALPAVTRGGAADLLQTCGIPSGASPPVILFHVAFRVESLDVGGRIVLALDAASTGVLQQAIGRYIARLLDEPD
ncbi:chemotaxis protein CheC [Azospirillum thermophilum]|uniref:chemotaxis protein CheC n=1 Tax=Azospirillum thermophilum TaxID=2202148 RepID=UPI001FE76C39|nr:chemotaxis protein CheC [Azospirillum thermophilum]